MDNRKISIVIPAYNEEESIEELYKQCLNSLKKCFEEKKASDYEIWFINDGSTDGTKEIIKRIINKDNKVHLISFRKNFGKSPALDAAFHKVSGDLVFTLDADLQDDPKEFSRFIDKIDEGYDMVVGWKYDRQDPMEKKLPSLIFNKVTSKMSGINLHDFDCGFKCIRREVVKSIDVYGELHRYIPVLAYRKGFKISEITVTHHKRQFGKSKYGIERYMRGALDSLTVMFLLKYSDRPMYLFGKAGLYFSLIGFTVFFIMSLLGLYKNNKTFLNLMVIFIITGVYLISLGLLANLIVENFWKNRYSENHIEEIL